jgi:hypothetical protein
MREFENEWVLETLKDRPGFFTKRMFGGLAVYLGGRQMMVIVEPTKTGRWRWHGALICTERAHHPELLGEFPQLAPHEVLKKWLYIDARHEEFEPVMVRVVRAIARGDRRFGIPSNPTRGRTSGNPGFAVFPAGTRRTGR